MRVFVLLVALSLAGCGRGTPPPPGGLSAEDNALLNNAAAMLDARAGDNTAEAPTDQAPNGA